MRLVQRQFAHVRDLLFTGDVVSYQDRYDSDIGWIREYRALGLRNRADWIPVTDSNTLTDNVRYNMPANNLNTILSRLGRNMGQAVLDLLSMSQNQAWLGGIPGLSPGYGIGNYVSQGYGGAGTAVLGGTPGTNNTNVVSITVSSIGSGYTTAPTVVIAGPCTLQATATATVSGGTITAITLSAPNYGGAGYLTTPAVIVSNLPSLTVSDCAALQVISPFTLAFAGERIPFLGRVRDPDMPSQSLGVGRSGGQYPHSRPKAEHNQRDHAGITRQPAMVDACHDEGHFRHVLRGDCPGRFIGGRLHAGLETMARIDIHIDLGDGDAFLDVHDCGKWWPSGRFRGLGWIHHKSRGGGGLDTIDVSEPLASEWPGSGKL